MLPTDSELLFHVLLAGEVSFHCKHLSVQLKDLGSQTFNDRILLNECGFETGALLFLLLDNLFDLRVFNESQLFVFGLKVSNLTSVVLVEGSTIIIVRVGQLVDLVIISCFILMPVCQSQVVIFEQLSEVIGVLTVSLR